MPQKPPQPVPVAPARPAAAHVRAALVRGAQAKMAEPPRPMAGHVRRALSPAQAKLPEPVRPPAPHVGAALASIQKTSVPPAAGSRPPAPHVRAALGGGAQSPAVQRFKAAMPHHVIQGNLTTPLEVKEGTFKPDLKTVEKWGEGGMEGMIEFVPGEKAPDAAQIKLLQIVRRRDVSLLPFGSGSEAEVSGALEKFSEAILGYDYTGDNAPKNNLKTEEGFGVDHWLRGNKLVPRAKSSDQPVSPYYGDHVRNTDNRVGYKKAADIRPAILWDNPTSSNPHQIEFETVAQDPATGHVYGSLIWGFTVITGGAKALVRAEHARAQNAPSGSFTRAVEKFHAYYKNPQSDAGSALTSGAGGPDTNQAYFDQLAERDQRNAKQDQLFASLEAKLTAVAPPPSARASSSASSAAPAPSPASFSHSMVPAGSDSKGHAPALVASDPLQWFPTDWNAHAEQEVLAGRWVRKHRSRIPSTVLDKLNQIGSQVKDGAGRSLVHINHQTGFYYFG